MTLKLAAVAIVALVTVPGVALAGTYKSDGCQLTVPDDWVASKTQTATRDKKFSASLMHVSTAAEAVRLELGFGAVKVSEDGRLVILLSTASYGGLTNKQYHAVTKTIPSCLADVTAPAGPGESIAKSIAATVGLAK
jgi:hypothetical protein